MVLAVVECVCDEVMMQRSGEVESSVVRGCDQDILWIVEVSGEGNYVGIVAELM